MAALIGDIVGSRRVTDRVALQRRIEGVLAEVQRAVGGELSMTIGDEFQGRFDSLDGALEASLRLHLGTWATTPIRVGIGWGSLLLDASGSSFRGQDGPAWWRARDAIDRLEGPIHPVRTVLVTETEWDDLLNAFLTTRDTLLAAIDELDARICLGLLDGETQRSMAGRLELHESSVSRRVHGHGLAALVASARPRAPLGSVGGRP